MGDDHARKSGNTYTPDYFVRDFGFDYVQLKNPLEIPLYTPVHGD